MLGVSPNTKFAHPAPKRIGMQVQHLCCTAWTFDHAVRFFKDVHNMATLDLLEGQEVIGIVMR